MKNDGRIQAGDKVVFTGHGYRRAIAYRYADMFGSRTYTVKETRRSCCNKRLKGCIQKYFSADSRKEVPPYPIYP